MSEAKIAQQIGTQSDIGFIVTSVSDEAFELLDPEDQQRVQGGQHIAIENSGSTRVWSPQAEIVETQLTEGRETLVEPRVIVPAGTFKHVRGDIEAPYELFEIDGKIYRIIDISGTDPRLSGFGERLNGSTARARKHVRRSLAEGILHHGIVKGAQILGTKEQGIPGTLMARPSNEPNERDRVGAVFTLPQDGSTDSYVYLWSKYSDLRRGASTVSGMI